MAFQVTNQKTGHSFPVENTETVLDAAMRQSRAFSYTCRSAPEASRPDGGAARETAGPGSDRPEREPRPLAAIY